MVAAVFAACDGPTATLYVEDAASFLADADISVAEPEDTAAPRDRGRLERDTETDPDPEDTRSPDVPSPDADADPDPDPATDTGRPDAPIDPEDASDLDPACIDYPATLEFGARIVGRDHEEVLLVRNCGGFEARNLVIESMIFVNDDVITSAPEFTFIEPPDFPFSMGPRQTWAFNIGYLPTAEGEHSAVIRMQTNVPDGATLDVAVSGSAF